MTPICLHFPERKDGAKQGWWKIEIDWVAMVSEMYSSPNPRNIILHTRVSLLKSIFILWYPFFSWKEIGYVTIIDLYFKKL